MPLKNGPCVINLDEYADVGTHCIALYCKNNEIVYFDSFGVEQGPKEIKKVIGHKNIKPRVQENNEFRNVAIRLHWIHWFYVCR